MRTIAVDAAAGAADVVGAGMTSVGLRLTSSVNCISFNFLSRGIEYLLYCVNVCVLHQNVLRFSYISCSMLHLLYKAAVSLCVCGCVCVCLYPLFFDAAV